MIHIIVFGLLAAGFWGVNVGKKMEQKEHDKIRIYRSQKPQHIPRKKCKIIKNGLIVEGDCIDLKKSLL